MTKLEYINTKQDKNDTVQISSNDSNSDEIWEIIDKEDDGNLFFFNFNFLLLKRNVYRTYIIL